jgi:hypothetical protein
LSGMDDHGANVVVTKKDGTRAQGELLAVKRNALVVSTGETSTGESISISIEEIGKVEVIKKSVEKGMLWGALSGAGIGVAGGLIAGDDPPGWLSFSAGEKAILGGFYGGVIGLLIGTVVGAFAGTGKTFRFENLSKEDREAALLKLSNYAAIKGVR